MVRVLASSPRDPLDLTGPLGDAPRIFPTMRQRPRKRPLKEPEKERLRRNSFFQFLMREMRQGARNLALCLSAVGLRKERSPAASCRPEEMIAHLVWMIPYAP